MTTREELRRRGEAVRETLFGAGEAALAVPAAGVAPLLAELAYGGIWTRPGLSMADRMACTLGALTAVPNPVQLRRHVAAALRIGLAPRAVTEVLLQVGIYRGFAAAESALEVALAVFAEHGIDAAALDPGSREDPLETLMARGRALQAELHGARKDEAHAAPDNPVTGSIYPLVVQHCYGEVWDRPGLDNRLRALVAVAAFAALDHDPLLRKFALSALNVGATRGEVIEAVVQIGPYAGFAFMLKGLSAVGAAFGTG
ncbi:MAG: carboxymuconolactone decarboxylase family protein [Acetobacteraceae bacterium]|nr:carboxymuconolactone decarboxylase family protein [Acetobacteraceae bacterium]